MRLITPGPSGSPSGGPGQAPANNQVIAVRVAIIGGVLLLLFAIVFFRLWYLQVLTGNSLAAEASQNRQRTVAVTAPRGDILDRNGKTLVKNRRALVVELAPASLPESERTAASEYGQKLGKYLALPKAQRERAIRPKVAPVAEPELRQRYERLGKVLGLQATEVRRRVIRSLYLVPYANAQIRKDVEDDIPPYIAERQDEFKGVTTSLRYVRRYQMGDVGSQLFGQVGPVSDADKDDPKFRKVPENGFVGKGGIEYEYDGYLRGQDGQSKATVNAFGEVQGEPEEVPVRVGSNLQTTLDVNLMKSAQSALAGPFNPNKHPGAAVALDPRNGEVLAMASYPTFDANIFSRPLEQSEYERLVSDGAQKPLFNRAISGVYPAASTFKIVPSFAATAEGIITPSTPYNDTGEYKVDANQTRYNSGKQGHGTVDMRKAITVSSSTYFYDLAVKLNGPREPLQRWARRFGFGKPTGIDLPQEAKGLIPDKAWRKQKAEEERECRAENDIPMSANIYAANAGGCAISDMREWSVGDNISLSIGQGDVGVTPLQVAVAYSAVQNGGTRPRPHLGKATTDRTGAVNGKISVTPGTKMPALDPVTLSAVRDGLGAAASEGGGTSADVFANWPNDDERFKIHGKTGTGQQDGKEDQSWYAAYVNHPTKPIVVVVTIEEGGFGAKAAAPIAGEMLKTWFNLRDVEIAAGESSTR